MLAGKLWFRMTAGADRPLILEPYGGLVAPFA